MANEKSDGIKTIISAFTMAEDAMIYSLTLSQLILNEHITSGDFKKVELPDSFRKINWTDYPAQFLEQTQNLPMGIFAFELLKCAEGYFDLFGGKTADPKDNSDLHSAQTILKIIRNSFGHPYAKDGQVIIRWNCREIKYRHRFEVKAIGIVLDATNLNEKDFKLGDLGANGWESLFKLLNYLKKDLEKRI